MTIVKKLLCHNLITVKLFTYLIIMSKNQIPDHLQNRIDQIIKEMRVEKQKQVVVSPLKPGDNWLGQILEINVVGQNSKNEHVTINLVAKFAPTIKLYRNFFAIEAVYKREIYMYNTVLPEFIKIQQENNIKNTFAPIPKCYQTCLDKPQETIVLENMKTLGYKSINQQLPIDYEHASLIMRACGKLHALSFALRNQKPELFKELGANTKESYLYNLRDSFIEIIQTLSTKVLNYIEKDSAAYKPFQKFAKNPAFVVDELIQPDIAGEYAVIGHGDNQTRNILFKYENDDNPSGLCLIDWQLSRFGSPVLDISFFIWICTDKKFRDQHYEDLIKVYYSSFTFFLRELGGDPEKSFPISVLNDHLKKFSVFGMFAAVWAVSANLTDSEDIPNVGIADSSKSIINMLSTVANNAYFTRIVEVVEDFIKYDYKFDGIL